MKLNKKKEETVRTLRNNLIKDGDTSAEGEEQDRNISVKDMCHLMCGVKHQIMETLDNPSLKNSHQTCQVVLYPSEASLLELKDSVLDQVEINRERAKYNNK